jgi:hypothetical protein
MLLSREKVERIINEKTDSAIYTIKSKLVIEMNTDVSDNDVFLAASTESVVDIFDTNIHDIEASYLVIHSVSSFLTF